MSGLYSLISPVNKALMHVALGVVSLPGVHQALQVGFRPAAPAAAYHLGEELVGRPRRVLAITCHPDDLAFFAGGTLARLHLGGSYIHALVLSDGEKGGGLHGLGALRRSEEQRVGQVLGFDRIEFVGLPDYGLEYDPRLLPVLEEVWRRVQPDVVLGFHPKELVPGLVNRDHQALGQALLELAGRPLARYTRVYFYGTRDPSVLVDIQPVLERKVAAVMQHQSQLRYLIKPLYPYLVRMYASMCGAGVTPQGEGLFRVI
jgi:LmbE family N-acetylglucosaminyl deacetylase